MPTPEEIRDRLIRVTELLNQEIIKEEEHFKSMNLGVQCWIDINNNGTIKLGYTNENKHEWRLCISQMRDGKLIIWMLNESPRQLRLFGIKHVNLLKIACIKAAESLANRIEKYLNGEQDTNENPEPHS